MVPITIAKGYDTIKSWPLISNLRAMVHTTHIGHPQMAARPRDDITISGSTHTPKPAHENPYTRTLHGARNTTNVWDPIITVVVKQIQQLIAVRGPASED